MRTVESFSAAMNASCSEWLAETIYEAEPDLESQFVKHHGYTVAKRVRLVRRLFASTWTDEAARQFAADCAEHVLDLLPEGEHKATLVHILADTRARAAAGPDEPEANDEREETANMAEAIFAEIGAQSPAAARVAHAIAEASHGYMPGAQAARNAACGKVSGRWSTRRGTQLASGPAHGHTPAAARCSRMSCSFRRQQERVCLSHVRRALSRIGYIVRGVQMRVANLHRSPPPTRPTASCLGASVTPTETFACHTSSGHHGGRWEACAGDPGSTPSDSKIRQRPGGSATISLERYLLRTNKTRVEPEQPAEASGSVANMDKQTPSARRRRNHPDYSWNRRDAETQRKSPAI